MAYKQGICYIEGVNKAVQEHHVIPLEYGGPKNGRTVKLCATCHLTCHYEAEHYHRTGEYIRADEEFVAPDVNKRAKLIIDYIVRAKSKFESSNESAQDARRMVGFNCSHEELRLLHAAKSAVGQRNLSRFIKRLVFEQLVVMRQKGKL